MDSNRRPRAFRMIRNFDETGVSGTGIVAEGCVFSDGKCVVRWLGENSCTQDWDTFRNFFNIHIRSHPKNKTEIVWL